MIMCGEIEQIEVEATSFSASGERDVSIPFAPLCTNLHALIVTAPQMPSVNYTCTQLIVLNALNSPCNKFLGPGFKNEKPS